MSRLVTLHRTLSSLMTDATFRNVVATGTLTVGGASTLSSLSVAGTLTIDGTLAFVNADVGGTLSVGGASTLQAVTATSLTASGNGSFAGTLTANTINVATSVTLGDSLGVGNLFTTRSLTCSGSLTIAAGLSIGGILTVAGGVVLTGNLVVNGTLSVTNTATIGGNLTLNTGGLTVAGNSTVSGPVSAGATTITGTLSTGAGLVVDNGPLTVSGNLSTTSGSLSVGGTTSLAGNVTAGAGVTVTGGNIVANSVTGTASVACGAVSAGSVTAATSVSAPLVSTQQLTCTDLSVTNPGTFTWSGTTGNIAGALTLGGALTIGGATSLGALTVAGTSALHATSIAGTLNVTGDVSVQGVATVSGGALNVLSTGAGAHTVISSTSGTQGANAVVTIERNAGQPNNGPFSSLVLQNGVSAGNIIGQWTLRTGGNPSYAPDADDLVYVRTINNVNVLSPPSERFRLCAANNLTLSESSLAVANSLLLGYLNITSQNQLTPTAPNQYTYFATVQAAIPQSCYLWNIPGSSIQNVALSIELEITGPHNIQYYKGPWSIQVINSGANGNFVQIYVQPGNVFLGNFGARSAPYCFYGRTCLNY